MDRRKEQDEYEEYLYQRELSERTVQIYLIQVEKFWDFLGDRPISKRETVAYKNHMKDNGWKVTTINLYVVAVNSYLVFAGYEECVLKTERVQRRQCPDDVLSGQEYHKLLEYTKQRGNEKYYCVEVAGKCNPKEMLDVVWKDVEKFQKGEEQFDDITMMAITWHGGNYMEKTEKPK